MIILTVMQLLECAPALQALAAQSHKGRVAFRIRKIVQTLNPHIQAASVSRDSLFHDGNSTLLENGNRQLKPEFTAAFLADPLFAETVKVELEPLTCDDLADALISPGQLESLGPLLKDS